MTFVTRCLGFTSFVAGVILMLAFGLQHDQWGSWQATLAVTAVGVGIVSLAVSYLLPEAELALEAKRQVDGERIPDDE
jgi:threonine/homoserine efflux transporter RhtA